MFPFLVSRSVSFCVMILERTGCAVAGFHPRLRMDSFSSLYRLAAVGFRKNWLGTHFSWSFGWRMFPYGEGPIAVT